MVCPFTVLALSVDESESGLYLGIKNWRVLQLTNLLPPIIRGVEHVCRDSPNDSFCWNWVCA